MSEIKLNPKCSNCKCFWTPEPKDMKSSGLPYKTCQKCRERDRSRHQASKCMHNKAKHRCKDCGGASLCEHQRVKYSCKECGGGSFCEHGKHKYFCHDCGGGGICVHGRRKVICILCEGSAMCQHKIQRSACSVCDPSGYLRTKLHNRLSAILKKNELELDTALLELLGISYSELVAKFGGINPDFEIDHIKPISAFDLRDEKQMRQCWHHSNLRQIPAYENRTKWNKWSDEDEHKWRNEILDKALL